MKINSPLGSTLYNYIERIKTRIDWLNYTQNTNVDYPLDHGLDGIPTYKQFEVEQINADSSPVIVIDNIAESINSQNYFVQYDTDKYYIIFSNGGWDKKYYPLPINYTNIQHYFWFYEFTDYLFNPNKFQFNYANEYTFEYPKKCIFVSTTGTTRLERDIFVDNLKKKFKADNYIFRYSYQDIGLPAGDIDIANGRPGEFDGYTISKSLEKYYHNVSLSLPIDMYNLAYFNLVVEGDIDWPNQFNPTEKIVKTLIAGMPFVVVASPFFLKNIRHLGFKTFDSLWDESYDSIIDYRQRIDAVIELCNRLINFKWEENKVRLSEIAHHNRYHFMKLNTIFDKEVRYVIQQLSSIDTLNKI